MIKPVYHVIGVMSGTSLDGIDLVYVKFDMNNNCNFDIIHAQTVSYDKLWHDKLVDLVSYDLEQLRQIDKEYTYLLAKTIEEFIDKYTITSIDAICSHGHTALHRPEEKLTYQIGNLPTLSKVLKKTVVCDFRVGDVELGGEGAPLVPIGDKLLFSDYDYCLNLGGFANISTDVNKSRIAYDICPVNIVLNHYVKRLGQEFDDKGNIASKGILNTELLTQLNHLEFYKQLYPKSLGLEWVVSHVFPLIDAFKLGVKDVLKTFCEHIAMQISNEINEVNQSSILVTGGGVYNTYLMDRIKNYSNGKIVIPSQYIIEFKEALIFALLGVLRLRNEVNCLKSVTGASKNHSSGRIFHP
ncbi:anhydro-N-acetylmuramic acid kinase [Aestuariivivens sediminis]|uniref:anhydro-N-acetylmuramic acid kinase n=1 Tax=Aestuariivivens sediminis TaxID=2913557 RepID=UPI001F5A4528|nr:anhydro-N-acetylmuramic acid kinase [Aestuariivivens sediminis]